MGLLGGCQRVEAEPKVRHAGPFVKKGQIRIMWGLRRCYCYGPPSDPKFGHTGQFIKKGQNRMMWEKRRGAFFQSLNLTRLKLSWTWILGTLLIV